MSQVAATSGLQAVSRVSGAAIVASYAFLGTLLLWSRLTGLDGGYCCDEIATVVDYVRKEPGTIVAGSYAPNNHELFSLLAWAATSLLGESEVLLRLLAALPFVVGVIVVTVWLHLRVSALSGILFVFLATASPLLLDLTRLARGYGLAFLAMSVLVVAALEAGRPARATWAVPAFCAAGVVGTFTLPHFVIAFVTIGAVLFVDPRLRRRLAVGVAVSLLAIGIWYSPHVDDILTSSRQEYGIPIESAWIVTAPLDQTLVPAMTLLDDALLRPNYASLLVVAVFAIVMASSPLLRRRGSALILCSSVVTTVGAFWLTGTQVVPRFFSFLLVPLLVLVATGAAHAFARLRKRSPRSSLVAALALAMLTAVGLRAAPLMAEVPRTPRESLREAAAAIRELAPPTTPVVAHVPHPLDLKFHLGRPFQWSSGQGDVARACADGRATVFVVQPWLVSSVTIPCAGRDGTRHYRFTQYARGEAVDVWLVPAKA